jgi:sugar-specific transcriptional regulator TrmB
MKTFQNEIIIELLNAMDEFKTIAEQLINKVINETNQPEIESINKGNYDEIENADFLNDKKTLSDNWYYDVHGEHCMFENTLTGQTLEVSLAHKEHIANLDPYFFYNFIKTTKHLTHLTKHFESPFKDMLDLFEDLEQRKLLKHIYRIGYRKI